MSKSVSIRIALFLIFSASVAGLLFSQAEIRESSIAVTLCGGTAQPLDYFSADYAYTRRVSYPGGDSRTTIRFKPDPAKSEMGHRFDFGEIPGETFLISSIVWEKPGYRRYVLDLDRAGEWIKHFQQLKQPKSLGGQLLIETTGNDGFLLTRDHLFERYAVPRFNLSIPEIAWAVAAEVFFLLLLLAFPRIANGLDRLKHRLPRREFLPEAAIFLAVNLFLIFPVTFWVCRSIPDVFSIELEAPNPFGLEIFYRTPYSPSASRQASYSAPGQYQTLTIPLPDDARRNRIRIDFGEIRQPISIKSISVCRFALIRHSLDLARAADVYRNRNHIGEFDAGKDRLRLTVTGNDPYLVPHPEACRKATSGRLVFGGVFRGLAAAEILLLLLLSQTGRKLIRKISPVELSDRKNLLLSFSVAGAFAFIMTFSLPLQTFKMAEEIILFPMDVLLKPLFVLAPAVFLLLAAILFFLNRRFGAIFSILLAAVTFLFAVECGFLSFGLPELNGDFDAYYNVPRMLMHIAVWTAGILLPLLFQKRIVSWIPPLLLAMTVLNGAALVDALMRKNPLEGRGKLIVKSTVNFDGTIERVKYARSNNVIMICLDAVTTEAVREVFRNSPELKKVFSGFTLLGNNIGMNVVTMWAVPGFFTGKPVSPEIPITQYTSGMYSEDSALKKYIDRHYAIYFRIGLPRLSYIYPDQAKSRKVSLLTPVEDSMLQWMFHELFLFKITPFFLKGRLMRHYFYTVWPNRQKGFLSDTSAHTAAIRDENYIYGVLAQAPLLGKEFPGAFHYHHFHGGHQPFQFDKDGKPVDRSAIPWQNDWRGYYERVMFEMKRVAKYFEALKKRGLYDDSVIIVCADHGLEPTRAKHGIPPRYAPLLMVKCRNSTAPFAETDLPTSHCKIAEFLKSDDIFAVKQRDVPGIFFTPIRQIVFNNERIITIDADRKIVGEKVLNRETSLREPVIGNYKYSLYHVGNDRFPPIASRNFNDAIQGLVLGHSKPASISFRTADRSASYKIEFEASTDQCRTPDVRFEIEAASGAKTEFRRGSGRILLSHVKPDPDGVVTLKFKRHGGSGMLFLTGLMIAGE